MATDTHCHPGDLLNCFPEAEAERRKLGIACAASAWNGAEFVCHEELARKSLEDRGPPMVLCFAVHPQFPAMPRGDKNVPGISSLLRLLETLVMEGRLDAVGETGFDLYNSDFRSTETLQDLLFGQHLELALSRGLPLVLHIRKAMHKVFLHTKALKRLPAVIFHSYSGTLGEGEALLRRGVNAYFSFGTPILGGHKGAIGSCAGLPLDRLLIETDAPYQPLRGSPFSCWGDLPLILQRAASLREGFQGNRDALEAIIDANFYRAYGNPGIPGP